jgi:hypothetical protein
MDNQNGNAIADDNQKIELAEIVIVESPEPKALDSNSEIRVITRVNENKENLERTQKENFNSDENIPINSKPKESSVKIIQIPKMSRRNSQERMLEDEAIFGKMILDVDKGFLVQEKEYDDEIKKYLECMGCTDYQIVETETGQIPMTTYPFWESNSANILHIGTAGGWTKASSGYTFYFTQKKSKALCEFLKTAKDISRFQRTNRFRFYDLVMLDLLVRRNDLGKQFFTSVYKNQPVGRVFDFLNEESSLLDEARIIFSSRPRKELIRSVSRVLRYWLGF